MQFRNVATVGGSIWGRFGFSDVMTIFRALGAKVQLHKAGIMDLDEFAALPRTTRDVLVSVIVPFLFATAHVSTGKSVDWFLWLKYTTPFAFFGTITDTSTSRVVLGSAANSSKSIIPAL